MSDRRRRRRLISPGCVSGTMPRERRKLDTRGREGRNLSHPLARTASSLEVGEGDRVEERSVGQVVVRRRRRSSQVRRVGVSGRTGNVVCLLLIRTSSILRRRLRGGRRDDVLLRRPGPDGAGKSLRSWCGEVRPRSGPRGRRHWLGRSADDTLVVAREVVERWRESEGCQSNLTVAASKSLTRTTGVGRALLRKKERKKEIRSANGQGRPVRK